MSDGRFSSKPIRSEKARDLAWAGEFTADAHSLTAAARTFVDSRAVQREINALMEHIVPEIGAIACAPLHKNTPGGAMELGRPLASATLVQEYLIGLLFLRVAGWFFMACAALFLVSACGLFLGRRDPGDPSLLGVAAFLVALALAVGGVGVWFGIVRGRVITEMCWFCPRGMIWMTEGAFDWFAWEEVREVYCHLRDARPAIGIRFDRNLSLISFSNTQVSRRMVEYIENRASAACAAKVLQLIAEERTVRFGDWRLSRTGLRGPETDIVWRDVADIVVDDRLITIRFRAGEPNVMLSLERIAFPSLFIALAHGIHAFTRESP